MTKKVENLPCELCLSRKFSLFNEVAPEHLCILSSTKNSILHKKGQTLFYEGTRPMGLFCISTGIIKVYKTSSNGKEQIIRLAKKGDFLGYTALLSEEQYSSSASVIEDAKVCFIPRDIFMQLLSTDSKLYQKLMKAVCHEMGILEEKVAEVTQKSVRERLAHTILMLKSSYGMEAEETKINIALTREDLANIVGTATETVIRLLSEFKDDGFIEFDGKKIKVTNPKALAKTADYYA